jgi:hypothetical protein
MGWRGGWTRESHAVGGPSFGNVTPHQEKDDQDNARQNKADLDQTSQLATIDRSG